MAAPLVENSATEPGLASRFAPVGWLVAAAGISAGAISSFHNNLKSGSLLIDPYWVGFYIANYQDGFRRRALIGSLCRLIFPHGISVIPINVVVLVAVFVLMVIGVRGFRRLEAAPSLRTSVFTFAFFFSIFSAIFFEILGDTLQLAFVLFFCVLLAASKARSPVFRLVVGLLVVTLGFFIHEASIFFLAPALPFFLTERPRPIHFAAPVLLFLGLLAVSMHWSQVDPTLTYRVVMLPQHIHFTDRISTPDFRSLLRIEAQLDFGSRANVVRFVLKCLRIVVLLFSGLVGLASCLSLNALRRLLPALGAILIFSIPLWIIAHDWGRFLAYSFFVALVAASRFSIVEAPSHAAIDRLAGLLRAAASYDMIAVATLLALFSSETGYSRVVPLSLPGLTAFVVVLLMALVVRGRGRRIEGVAYSG